MVRMTLFSILAAGASTDDTFDSAGLLQSKQISKLSSKSPTLTLSDGEEDCTGKDMYLWLGGHKEAATHENLHLWIQQTPSQFSTAQNVIYARTLGETCADWCADHGKVCVRGMDDAHWQKAFLAANISDGSRCSIWASGHGRKRQDEAGCRQRWRTQMCACGGEIVLNMGHQCQNDADAVTVLHRACAVGAANPNDPFDCVQNLDMLLTSDIDAATTTNITTNTDGHLVITSNGGHPIQAQWADLPGREVIMPPSFAFTMKPVLIDGQTVTIHAVDTVGLDNDDGALSVSNNELVLSNTTSVSFSSLPSFSVNSNGGGVVVQITVTPNLVSDCDDAYTEVATDTKVAYQNSEGYRLWRITGQTREQCYERCAADARCKYFSHNNEAASDWYGVCMGGEPEGHPERDEHTHFTYYEVCKRSDVTRQCDRHDEHSCKSVNVLPDANEADGKATYTVTNATTCLSRCQERSDCFLFAFDGDSNQCELCAKHEVFQGHGGGSHWAVMSNQCENGEVIAKFETE